METKFKRFPSQILESAGLLGFSMPEEAKRTKQPSFYLKNQSGRKGFEEVYPVLKASGAVGRPGTQTSPETTDSQEEDKEKLAELYGWFQEMFCSQKNLEFHQADQDVFFTDWVLHCRKMGFRMEDYFDYELYKKGLKKRRTFISYRYRGQIIRSCILKEDRKKYLDDKAVFNETYRDFIGRDWLDLSEATYKDMKKFCKTHPHFFAKQKGGQGGQGAACYTNLIRPSEELYLDLKEREMILEEYVCQHPSIADFNSDSLNTIRVLTLLDIRGEVHVMLAAGRFGRSGCCVDNFHSGGIVVEVDPESGTITSNGIDRRHEKYCVHPDSGKRFKGFVYPNWDRVMATVREAAKKVPSLRHIGWDVAITDQGEVILIEGNGRPDMNMMQMAGQRGKKEVYVKLIGEIEERNRGGQHG